MKTQRIVIPEVVYSPSRDRYNKRNERKQYSHSNAKTAAMLTAAMLALAANAKADVCTCTKCQCLPNKTIICNNKLEEKQNNRGTLSGLDGLVLIPLMFLAAGLVFYNEFDPRYKSN